jgi:hypothetical protein
VVFKWSFCIAPSYPTCCTAIVGTIVVAMHPGERFNAAVYDLRALALALVLGFAAERATEHITENHKVRFCNF